MEIGNRNERTNPDTRELEGALIHPRLERVARRDKALLVCGDLRVNLPTIKNHAVRTQHGCDAGGFVADIFNAAVERAIELEVFLRARGLDPCVAELSDKT